jgi:hypothetical protein
MNCLFKELFCPFPRSYGRRNPDRNKQKQRKKNGNKYPHHANAKESKQQRNATKTASSNANTHDVTLSLTASASTSFDHNQNHSSDPSSCLDPDSYSELDAHPYPSHVHHLHGIPQYAEISNAEDEISLMSLSAMKGATSNGTNVEGTIDSHSNTFAHEFEHWLAQSSTQSSPKSRDQNENIIYKTATADAHANISTRKRKDTFEELWKQGQGDDGDDDIEDDMTFDFTRISI